MLVASTIAASAQITSVDVKANLRNDFGIGVGLSVPVDKFEFSPSFNYYFTDNAFFHIDADFHYNIDLGSDFTFYPIVGATYYHAKDFNKLGVDLGAGVKYPFTEKITGFLEGKYQWVDGADDSYFSLGVKIRI